MFLVASGVALFLPLPLIGQAMRERMREFSSRSANYDVEYPATWTPVLRSLPTLYIVNFPPSKRVRAIVLPEGGASIAVVSAPTGVSNSEQWLARDAKPLTQIVSVSKVAISAPNGAHVDTMEALLTWPVPNPMFEGVNSYIAVGGHLFSGRLTYLKGDANAPQYLDTLRRVLGSLRLRDAGR
jgi:hypothetical protein